MFSSSHKNITYGSVSLRALIQEPGTGQVRCTFLASWKHLDGAGEESSLFIWLHVNFTASETTRL